MKARPAAIVRIPTCSSGRYPDPGRLTTRAKRTIERALRKGPAVASTIPVLELATAVRRGRLQLGSTLDQWLADLVALPELCFETVSAEIARLAGSYAESTPGDPSDPIIMATASVLGAKLVTADERLRQSPDAAVVW